MRVTRLAAAVNHACAFPLMRSWEVKAWQDYCRQMGWL